MIIANPIYDIVFKRLMEDQRIAKFFVGTLLDETIEDLEVKPQELTFTDKVKGLTVLRFDFIATIRTGANEYKKVLIEIQKARDAVDLLRFRNYLAEQYKKEDEIILESGRKQKVALPIVTIYLLGFNLPELESTAVKVNRQYTDLLTHEIIHQKSDFIEKLTHDCYVVQLPRIHVKVQTRLEKLLSIFEQNYFVDDKGIVKEYSYAIDDDTIKHILDILHHAGTDPKRKKEIEDEQEAWRVITLGQDELKEKIMEQSKALSEKDKIIEELKRRLKED